MAQLVFLGPTQTIPGVGRTRRGIITTVPDELVPELLATGDWQPLETSAAAIEPPERVTEVPAPTPATKPGKKSGRR